MSQVKRDILKKATADGAFINTKTPKNADGELINPTDKDVSDFNKKYTTTFPKTKEVVNSSAKKSFVPKAVKSMVTGIAAPVKMWSSLASVVKPLAGETMGAIKSKLAARKANTRLTDETYASTSHKQGDASKTNRKKEISGMIDKGQYKQAKNLVRQKNGEFIMNEVAKRNEGK